MYCVVNQNFGITLQDEKPSPRGSAINTLTTLYDALPSAPTTVLYREYKKQAQNIHNRYFQKISSIALFFIWLFSKIFCFKPTYKRIEWLNNKIQGHGSSPQSFGELPIGIIANIASFLPISSCFALSRARKAYNHFRLEQGLKQVTPYFYAMVHHYLPEWHRETPLTEDTHRKLVLRCYRAVWEPIRKHWGGVMNYKYRFNDYQFLEGKLEYLRKLPHATKSILFSDYVLSGYLPTPMHRTLWLALFLDAGVSLITALSPVADNNARMVFPAPIMKLFIQKRTKTPEEFEFLVTRLDRGLLLREQFSLENLTYLCTQRVYNFQSTPDEKELLRRRFKEEGDLTEDQIDGLVGGRITR